MTEFKRGQSVRVIYPTGKTEPGFVKAIPGDTYTNSDGERITLTDRYWVKAWNEPKKALGAGYPAPVVTYCTVVVPADRLLPR